MQSAAECAAHLIAIQEGLQQRRGILAYRMHTYKVWYVHLLGREVHKPRNAGG